MTARTCSVCGRDCSPCYVFVGQANDAGSEFFELLRKGQALIPESVGRAHGIDVDNCPDWRSAFSWDHAMLYLDDDDNFRMADLFNEADARLVRRARALDRRVVGLPLTATDDELAEVYRLRCEASHVEVPA